MTKRERKNDKDGDARETLKQQKYFKLEIVEWTKNVHS